MRRSSFGIRAATVAFVVASVASCGTGRVLPGAEPSRGVGQSDGVPRAAVTKIADVDSLATSLAASADGSELLVADRTGVVRRIRRVKRDGRVVPVLDRAPVLDLHERVSLAGEQGFYDMAIIGHDRFLVVSFTALDGSVNVEQYTYRPGRAVDTSSRRTLLALPWRYPFHHGGSLAVDRSGNLLLGLGDEGLSLPGIPAPQDPSLLIGGVLSIPAEALSNPSTSWTPSSDRLVAKGLRNPWRMTVDAASGDVWIGDVGNAKVEEVNRIPGRDLGNRLYNFGWPYYEGSIRTYETIPSGLQLTKAVLERRQRNRTCGMVGGYIYHGRNLPALGGWYVYSDLCSQEIRAFRLGSGGVASGDHVLARTPETLVSMGQDRSGELYGLGSEGGVYRLDPVGWDVAPNRQSAPPDSSTTAVGPRIDCGLISALEPVTHLGSFGRVELRQRMEQLNLQLERIVPTLPPELKAAGSVIRTAFAHLTTELDAVGWDLSAPTLSVLRGQMLDATGPFTGFPAAMATFFASGCS